MQIEEFLDLNCMEGNASFAIDCLDELLEVGVGIANELDKDQNGNFCGTT